MLLTEPASPAKGKTVNIVPDKPSAAMQVPTSPLPRTEKKVAAPVLPPAPRLPAASERPPASAEPSPAPLPPALFPDVLPPPTPMSLQRSRHDEIVQRNPHSGVENQQSLTGEVQQYRRGWRLRYAAIDVEDAHGGSVALEGVGPAQIREGARIRVTGVLIPADDRHSSARFQVQSLDVIEP